MSKRLLSVVICILMFLPVMNTCAVDADEVTYPENARFMTVSGAGKKDGTSWDNAFEGNKENGLSEAWENTPSDATLYIEGGEYNVVQAAVFKSGGAENAMKSIKGIEKDGIKPTFTGDYDKLATADKGTRLITLETGIGNIVIDNIAVNNYSSAIYTNGKNTCLRFYNIDIKYFCDGFYLNGGATTDDPVGNSDIIIDGCTQYWYRKRGVRMKNGNNGVIISNCRIDCGGKDAFRKGSWPVGLSYENGQYGVYEENITAVDCVIENSYQESSPVTGYWDCDGVSGERATRNLTFVRVVCNSSTDSGFDFKTADQTLIDCVAMDNKRNYKFASDGAVMINCLSAYSHSRGGSGTSAGLWSIGKVKVYNSTFFNNDGYQIQADYGNVDLYNCIVGYNGKETALYKNENYIVKSNVCEYKNRDAGFNNMSSDLFYGDNGSWNTREDIGVGYRFDSSEYISIPQDTTLAGRAVDVSQSYAWAKDAIEFMNENGYTAGYSKMYFAPSIDTTRGEFAAMLARVLEIEPTKRAKFDDLPLTYEYRLELGSLQYLKVLTGDGNGMVRPFEYISREEAMALVCRALKASGKIDVSYKAKDGTLDMFNDKEAVSDWAKDELAQAVELGFVLGDENLCINPNKNITRAETAVMLQRVYNYNK